jgi:hypothetical protein
MSRVRLMLLSLVAVLSVGALTASAASAINFEWRVEGKKLEAGSSKTITSSTDGKLSVLKGSVGGATVELLSTEISVLSGANIKGGIPGTSLEQVVFSGITVDKSPKCEVSGKTVQTVPITDEIVEGASAGKGNGQVDILFRPESTTNKETFAPVTFVNKGTEECAVKNQTFNVTGLILALSLPEGAEAVNGDLDYEANTKEYRNSKNEFKTAGLQLNSLAATLTGLTLVTLEKGEKYGAF